MKLATNEKRSDEAKGDGTRESHGVTRIRRASTRWRISARDGRSKTSRRHSRYVSSTIGNDGYCEATDRRSCARFRWAQSGVRFPGERRGRSSALAAASRKRAAKSDVCPSDCTTSDSTSADGGKNVAGSGASSLAGR